MARSFLKREGAKPSDLIAHGVTRDGIPWEIEEAVKLWARQWGRGATIRMHPVLRCPCIEFELPNESPRMQAWLEGKVKFKPTEFVALHRQDPVTKGFKAIDLNEIGVSGLLSWLDEANSWSGHSDDIYTSLLKVDEKNEARRATMRKAIEDAAKETAWLHRRRIEGVPFVSQHIATPEPAPESDGVHHFEYNYTIRPDKRASAALPK